jgi:hypothetical protein
MLLPAAGGEPEDKAKAGSEQLKDTETQQDEDQRTFGLKVHTCASLLHFSGSLPTIPDGTSIPRQDASAENKDSVKKGSPTRRTNLVKTQNGKASAYQKCIKEYARCIKISSRRPQESSTTGNF